MSNILASSIIKPDDFLESHNDKNMHWDFCPDLISLASTSRIPLENKKIVEVEDLRILRSLSRAGLILYHVAKSSVEALNGQFVKDPIRAGLYCGVDQGPLDYKLVEEVANSQKEAMGATILRFTKPKQIFKMYPNYSTNQIGITLGVQGPMQTYTNMKFGSLHALEQAEFDLWHGVVDVALVCSSNSLEDPLVSFRVQNQAPQDSIISEGGAALILAKSSTRTNWAHSEVSEDKNFYGIAEPLIRIVDKHKL